MSDNTQGSLRTFGDMPAHTAHDGALVRELAGRSTGLTSHSLAHIAHPAGTASRTHHHTIADEVYYVSAGHGQILIDETAYALGPGDIVEIHPGQKHKIWCDGPEALELLVTCAPAYTEDEVRWDE